MQKDLYPNVIPSGGRSPQPRDLLDSSSRFLRSLRSVEMTIKRSVEMTIKGPVEMTVKRPVGMTVKRSDGMLIGGSGLLLIAVAAVIAAKITEHRISRNRHNEEVE